MSPLGPSCFALPPRFWEKVRVASAQQCWEWAGTKCADGYGLFRRFGVTERAHRLLMRSRGEVLDGLVIRHSCDNPGCVNPLHLIVGTQTENVRDRDERGRGRWVNKKGEEHGNAKLTDERVRALRAAYDALPRYPSGNVKHGELRKLASSFSLPYGTVRNVVDGAQWRHI